MDPAESPFSSADIERFARQASNLNAEGRGDQAAFYLGKARAAAPGASMPGYRRDDLGPQRE